MTTTGRKSVVYLDSAWRGNIHVLGVGLVWKAPLASHHLILLSSTFLLEVVLQHLPRRPLISSLLNARLHSTNVNFKGELNITGCVGIVTERALVEAKAC